MGVLGLWQLLAPVGQPVTLESLENKIFAVDISIWLNQAVKGYRDAEGGSVPNAHLHSLFSRLCKLLFYKIRPIIVFDGGFPELKRQTIINRQQRRAAVKQSSRDIGLKILSNYLASQNLAALRGEGSPKKTVIKHKERVRDELFILPPLPSSSQSQDNPEPIDVDSIDWKFTNFSKEDIRYLNQIDLESDDFNNLPPDVKQEILATLKESRKHRTWDQYKELPEDSNEFSSYQMQCLLKKRTLSKKLEQVQKDVRQINSADIVAQYTNDHVIGETNKIMSDDCSHYVLLKKIIQKSASDKTSNDSEMNASMIETKNAFIMDMENIDVSEVKYVDNKKDESLGSFNVKTEIESDASLNSDIEEDVDNPPVTSIDKVAELVNHYPEKSKPELQSSTVTNVKEIDGSDENGAKQTENKFDMNSVCSEEEDLKKINSSTSENFHVFDKASSEVEIMDEKVSSMKDNELSSSSDDEMIPCEEADSLYPDLIPAGITKCDNISISNAPFVNCDGEANISSQIFSSNNISKSDSVEPIPSTSFAPSKSTPLLSLPSSSLSDPLLEDAKDEEIARNLQLQSDFEMAKSLEAYEATNSTAVAEPLSEDQKAEMLSKNLQLQNDLEMANSLLEADRAKQDRQAGTVQDHMVEECKELLRLFGIPFIVSPTEAEAQCAFYDAANLTHGTITDDSDVWLFGGKRVYKNFFAQQKYVEFYKDSEIFSHFGLSRAKLVNFALLTGSDYTEGIEGVGPVRAMEIISEFPGEGIEALVKFKEWWQICNKHARPPENKVRAKLLKLVLSEKFPEDKVFDAYLNPLVDDSTEKFTWGRPDLDTLRDYTRERFGWNKSKVDEVLLPVIKKLSERESQTHIDNFFTVSLKKQKELFPSKRIMSALKKMTSPQKNSPPQETNTKVNKRKTKTESKKTVPKKRGRKCTNLPKKAVNNSKPKGLVLSEESSDEA